MSDERRGQMKDIAMTLSRRIGAAFLYDKSFDEEVQRITGEREEEEEDSFYWTVTRHTSTALADGKLKPTMDDLLDILEYMRLCQEEGVDHDMLPCVELAFDLATFFEDGEHMNPLGAQCMKLYEVSKGHTHKLTKKFRKKMQKYCL